MDPSIDPSKRAAPAPPTHDGQVTLINSFVVEPSRDDEFVGLWTETSRYFREQPGFVALRFHRALRPGATYRYVNVATWESLEQFQAAHATQRFRDLVGQSGWSEFPSSPALYDVIVDHTAQTAEPHLASI